MKRTRSLLLKLAAAGTGVALLVLAALARTGALTTVQAIVEGDGSSYP